MFEEPTLKAIEAVYEIRNLFGHNLEASFGSSDQKMRDAFKKLTLHDQHALYPFPFAIGMHGGRVEEVTDHKSQFIVNLKLLLLLLHLDQQRHLPDSNTADSP